MKALFELILVIALAYLAQMFLPWWGVIIAAAFAGLIINNKGGVSFLMGFFGVAILWFLQAYMIDSANESILSDKVAGIFTLSSMAVFPGPVFLCPLFREKRSSQATCANVCF